MNHRRVCTFTVPENTCQETIAAASRDFAGLRLASLQGCRNALLAGKGRFLDKGKTMPLADPAQCVNEYVTATKLSAARAALRTAVETSCTDGLVGSIATACAVTVDGLVDPTASNGCLLSESVAATDGVIGTIY